MKQKGMVLWLSVIVIIGGVRLAGAEPGIITVGSISEKPKEEIAVFQPFIDYVASRLPTEGIGTGRVVVASSIEQMAELINDKRVDFYIDSPYPVMKVRRLTGIQPFLRRWKKEKEKYSSIILVRRDSGIETAEDLKGKMIAFEEPYSTSSYFLPKGALMQHGLTLTQKKMVSDPVSPDEVGYVFTDDDETTVLWVLKERTAAGAIHDEDFKEFAKGRIGELKILLNTREVARQIVAHRADLDPQLITALKDVLLNMSREPQGQEVLKNLQKTAKFDEFPEGVEEAVTFLDGLLNLTEGQ